MAVDTNAPVNSTPGEIQKGSDVPSNLDAARPVIDRVKDYQVALDAEAGTISGGDIPIDNTPETAAEQEQAEEDAAAAEKKAKASAKSTKKDNG